MGKKYKKYKNFLEKFLDSNKGKRFFNIAYSVGAAIVIFGAMAKILHWGFGDEMLMIGMITEVIVFLISAFEKPAKEYNWEEVYPVLSDSDEFIPKNERVTQVVQPVTSGPAIRSTSVPSGTVVSTGNNNNQAVGSTAGSPVPVSGGGYVGSGSGGGAGTVIIGGAGGNTDAASGTVVSGGGVVSGTPGSGLSGNITIVGGAGSAGGTSTGAKGMPVGSTGNANFQEGSGISAGQITNIPENVETLAEITHSLNRISETLSKSFEAILNNSEKLGDNTQGYISQMETLNRNLAGLNTIYEVQLKGVSGQIGTIEHINAGLERIKKLYDGSLADSSIFKNETEKMAQQLAELNRVYARMLEAMTTNMNFGGGFGNSNQGNTPSQP